MTRSYKFSQLCIGDMFNSTKARWVKVDKRCAIVVMSGLYNIGVVMQIDDDPEVTVLYSAILETNP